MMAEASFPTTAEAWFPLRHQAQSFKHWAEVSFHQAPYHENNGNRFRRLGPLPFRRLLPCPRLKPVGLLLAVMLSPKKMASG